VAGSAAEASAEVASRMARRRDRRRGAARLLSVRADKCEACGRMVALSRCIVTSLPSCGAAVVHRKVERVGLAPTVDFRSHLIGWARAHASLDGCRYRGDRGRCRKRAPRIAFNEGGIFRRCKALDL